MSGFSDLVDLASLRLGGAVLYASDDFFAAKDNLLEASAPVFLEHEYTNRGRWMDGWESRRKRVEGNDYAIVRLGVPGTVRGVVVDTTFFRGNCPAECSIDGCAAPSDAPVDVLLGAQTTWFEVLPRNTLEGDRQNLFEVRCPQWVTHLRLNIYPDGGVARFRVHGEPFPDWKRIGHAVGEVDVAALEHGGQALACSDTFFGNRNNLIMPGRAPNMSDGWETRRRRGPGFDWVIVQLGARAALRRVELDTNHFKGNFPDAAAIDAIDARGTSLEDLARSDGWQPLLARTKLSAHTRHLFEDEIHRLGPVTHVRLSVFPDGGVSRLRTWGTIDRDERLALGLRRFHGMTDVAAATALKACCHSSRWVQGMLERRPFAGVTDVFAAAESVADALGPDDWQEAFAGHPRIGESRAKSEQAVTAKRWSAQEQAGTQAASAQTMAALAEVNREYDARFGYIYIVCATGRSAEEMLAFARERMGNDPATELQVAAGEQRKITRIRLEKLLEP